MKKAILKKYASLIVKTGVNVKKKQGVIISASVDVHDFALLVQEEAYKSGAKWVRIDFTSQESTRLKYKNETATVLSRVEIWEEEKARFTADTLPARIVIISDDPAGLKGVNAEKMQKVYIEKMKVLKKYIDATEDKHQWTIAAVPSAKWAKKVFPELRTNQAVEKMWNCILESVRITDSNDPQKEWAEHNANLEKKSAALNAMEIEYLHYKNSLGTDFKCHLMPQAIWKGGMDTTIDGTWFNPNLPTEEVFTTPMKGKAEGIVYSTKPLSYQGKVIEDFSITFENGKAVSCKAEKNQDVLEKMIATDEGASMIGELALIPNDSPISNSNVLYYNTLFDENASCHIALGRGYASNIVGFEKMTKEEMKELGLNDSVIHVDFMIGSDDMDIVANLKDGSTKQIFKNGNWAI